VLAARGHVAVMSPHRAQCAALRAALLPSVHGAAAAAGSSGGDEGAGAAVSPGSVTGGGPYKMIDTVEKLQGQEAYVVIYSATASCPAALAGNAEFYSSLHRCNVALSRARERLVVIASEAMLGFAPTSAARYSDLSLWKQLRAACAWEAGEVLVSGARVRVCVAQAPGAAAAEGVAEGVDDGWR
jgi:hypothetical protein